MLGLNLVICSVVLFCSNVCRCLVLKRLRLRLHDQVISDCIFLVKGGHGQGTVTKLAIHLYCGLMTTLVM